MNDSILTTVPSNGSFDHMESHSNGTSSSIDIVTIIAPTLCVFGVCGNVLNLIILFKGNLNESPYLYLKTLAVTDMFALILSFIHMTISRRSTTYEWQFFNVYIFFPFANFFMAASVWLTVGVTLDRFVFVKFPLWARGYCSVNRAKFRIILILLLTMLITTPRFFCYKITAIDHSYRMVPTAFRSPSSKYYRIYDIICIVLFHVAPLVIFMACNVYLIYAVHQAKTARHENNIRNNKENDWQKDQRRFTITLISIVLISIIAILPSTIGDFTRLLHIPSSKYKHLRQVSNILLLCNLSANFLLYCAFNKRFVRVMRKVLCGNKFHFGSPSGVGRSTKFSKIDTNMLMT